MTGVNDKKLKRTKRTFLVAVGVEEIISTESGLSGIDILVIKKVANSENYSKTFKKIIETFNEEMKEIIEDDI